MKTLPYGRQSIDESDVAAVVEALRSEFLTTGPRVEALERDLAERLGADHVVACANGTAALHLAYLAAGVGRGDTVIAPAVTFVATANAARLCGAEVVFADVDPATGLMTAETFAEALTRAGGAARVAAPVHLAGQSAPLAEIAAIATSNGVRLIEDACHAIGSTRRDGIVGDGLLSAAAAFSFHPVKTVTSAEGGAVSTNDAALAARMRQLRNHGLTRDKDAFVLSDLAVSAGGGVNPWYYEQHALGLNYRLSDLNCALLSSQLRRLPLFAQKRARLVARYHELLAELGPHVRALARLPEQTPCWHLMVALINFEALGADRRSVMAGLAAQGVGTQVHYIPVHLQPYYRNRYGRMSLLGSELFYRRALSLPLFPAMELADVDRVVGALREVLAC